MEQALNANPDLSDREEEAVVEAALNTHNLPFAFARRFGVVISNAAASHAELDMVAYQMPALRTLAEARRYLARPFKLRLVEQAVGQSVRQTHG